MGRLAKDPVTRKIKTKNDEEIKVTAFPLVVKRNCSKDLFTIMVTTYGKKAEFVDQYLKQGVKILVGGELTSTPYTDKDSNKKYFYTELILRDIEFVGGNFLENENKERPKIPEDQFLDIPKNSEEEMPFC